MHLEKLYSWKLEYSNAKLRRSSSGTAIIIPNFSGAQLGHLSRCHLESERRRRGVGDLCCATWSHWRSISIHGFDKTYRDPHLASQSPQLIRKVIQTTLQLTQNPKIVSSCQQKTRENFPLAIPNLLLEYRPRRGEGDYEEWCLCTGQA